MILRNQKCPGRSLWVRSVDRFGQNAPKMLVSSVAFSGMPTNAKNVNHRHSPAALLGRFLLVFLSMSPSGILTDAHRLPQAASAQTATGAAQPVVVQPGAPGQPTRTLPASTHATLPPASRADVEFMQGMIMHHSQALEMTAWILSHTDNKDLRALGSRINRSQSDEIQFMRRWLTARGQSTSMQMQMPMSESQGSMDHSMEHSMAHMDMHAMHLMPGMLTPEQMEALRNSKGSEFDRLFLTGMIQHHNGALTMVKDLFDTPGAGQDAELFDFATDADNSQRAEIRIMQDMLDKQSSEEKR